MTTIDDLAAWLGDAATAVDLDAAAQALSDAGLMHADWGDEDTASRVSAICDEHPVVDPAEAFNAQLIEASRQGGRVGDVIGVDVDPASPATRDADDVHVAVRLSGPDLDAERHWIWVRGDRVTEQARDLYDEWDAASTMHDMRVRSERDMLRSRMLALADAEQVVRRAREARDEAVRALIDSGVSMYALAQQTGLTQAAIRKIRDR